MLWLAIKMKLIKNGNVLVYICISEAFMIIDVAERILAQV